MRNVRSKGALLLVGGVLTLAVGVVALAVGPGPSEAQQDAVHDCPQPGKWAISVWAGGDATDAEEAFATCGEGAVAAAYYMDPQTQGWSRWFAGRPEMSTLEMLDNMQGVIALGGSTAAAGEIRATNSVRANQDAEQMHNCPQAGKWAISVWGGADGTDAAQALATCGQGAVAAAYYMDPQTQGWSRWFAGRPEMSTLETLDSMQGVVAYGTLSPPPAAPTPTPTPAVWSDGRIEIILDQVERTQVLPPDVVEIIYTSPPEELPTPAEGHDYVCVYLTIAHIENVHVVDALGHGDERATLRDAEGLSYELALGGVRGIEFLDPHHFTGGYEVVEGATDILVFELPVDKRPASLTFVYSFKETLEQATPERGQVDIGL
jgi:hypothetical protein